MQYIKRGINMERMSPTMHFRLDKLKEKGVHRAEYGHYCLLSFENLRSKFYL